MRESVLSGGDYMGRNTIAGYLLAGGENKRMQGEEKAFLMYRGIPFWKQIVEKMKLTGKIYISVAAKSGNRSLARNCFENFDLIEDLYEKKGPLGGILSGLSVCEEDALLVMPCDMPECREERIVELVQNYLEYGMPVFFQDGEYKLPFPGIYTKDMIPAMERMLQEKKYRMQDLLQVKEIGICHIQRPGMREELKNINTVEEYKELLDDNDKKGDRIFAGSNKNNR